MGEVFFRCHDCRPWFVELHPPQQEDWFYVFSFIIYLFIHSFNEHLYSSYHSEDPL